jgi:hypothetical protein
MKIRLGLRLMLTGGLFWVMAAHAYAVPALPDGSRVVLDSHDVAMVPEGCSSNISAGTMGARTGSGAEAVPALAASSVATGASASVGTEAAGDPPIKTLEFDEQFKGDTAPNWVAKSGVWFIGKNAEKQNDYLVSLGVAKETATVIYNKEFTNFIFKVRMKRISSFSNFTNRIILRANGTFGEDGHFQNEYEFQYSRDGQFSVYGRFGGSTFTLADWNDSSAVIQGSEWNELRVYANGSRFTFTINGEKVWSGLDSNISKGLVGMSFFRNGVGTSNKLLVDYAILKSFSTPASEANSLPPHLLTFSIARLLGGMTNQ